MVRYADGYIAKQARVYLSEVTSQKPPTYTCSRKIDIPNEQCMHISNWYRTKPKILAGGGMVTLQVWHQAIFLLVV